MQILIIVFFLKHLTKADNFLCFITVPYASFAAQSLILRMIQVRFFAHDKAHMLAGEGSGYHNDTRKVQVGSNTVNVPEEGHYEKKHVKAAWDEKVLVKEAGWY